MNSTAIVPVSVPMVLPARSSDVLMVVLPALGDGDQSALVIGIGEIDHLLSFRLDEELRDDGVDVAGLQRRDQRAELHRLHAPFAIQAFCDLAKTSMSKPE